MMTTLDPGTGAPRLPDALEPVTYAVSHETLYQYSQAVTVSHHLAHLSARSFATQQVLGQDLRLDPRPDHRTDRPDYFGNTATRFSFSQPHDGLRVLSRLVARITPPRLPDPETTPPWEEVVRRLDLGIGADILEACQVRHASPHVPALPEAAAYGAPSFPPGRPILTAALDLMHRIHTEFTYDPSATTIATPLASVLAHRRGVCQDFAHLMIACLRARGLAARYVSGYVLTALPDGGPRLEGGDASHAWASLYVPAPLAPNGGWIDLDPTNDKVVTREHVVVAWGRDFEDVSPLKGVMLGGGGQWVGVSVSVTPATPPPDAPLAVFPD